MGFSFSNLFDQIKELMLTPADFWKKQKDEAEDSKTLWLTFQLPILLTLALAVFMGEFFSRTDFFLEYPLLKALREIVLFVLTYLLGVYLSTGLMKSFGAKKNAELVRILVIYSMTPLLLVSVVTGLFPFLYVLDIAGLYSFYLFWIGVKELLTFPDNKEQSYILIAIVSNFFIFSFLSVFLSKLLNAYY